MIKKPHGHCQLSQLAILITATHLEKKTDAPTLYNLILYLNAPITIMKKMVLGFCGFKPIRTTAIGSVKSLSGPKRSKIIEDVTRLGSQGV
jgi:NAD(P)H dehydrogenase (quinone)